MAASVLLLRPATNFPSSKFTPANLTWRSIFWHGHVAYRPHGECMRELKSPTTADVVQPLPVKAALTGQQDLLHSP